MRSVVDRNVVMQRITCIALLTRKLCAKWGRGGVVQRHFLTTIPPGRSGGYPLYRRVCRSAGWSGNFEQYLKNSTAVGNRTMIPGPFSLEPSNYVDFTIQRLFSMRIGTNWDLPMQKAKNF